MIGGDCRADRRGHTVDRDHGQGLGDDRRVVAVGVIGKEIQRRRRILGQTDIIVIGDRRHIVAGTGDFQRQGRRVGAALAVGDGVGEGLDAGFAVAKRLGVGIEIVEGIFPAAVGIDGERTIAAGHDLGEGQIDGHVGAGLAGAGIDIGDGQTIGDIHVAVIVEHIARGSVVARDAKTLLDQRVGGIIVGNRDRAIIRAGDGDSDVMGIGRAEGILDLDRVGHDERFTIGEKVEGLAAAVECPAATRLIFHAAQDRVCIDRQH